MEKNKEDKYEKSLRLLNEFIKNEPEKFKEIIEKADKMKFEGPTLDEYINSLGIDLNHPHSIE